MHYENKTLPEILKIVERSKYPCEIREGYDGEWKKFSLGLTFTYAKAISDKWEVRQIKSEQDLRDEAIDQKLQMLEDTVEKILKAFAEKLEELEKKINGQH